MANDYSYLDETELVKRIAVLDQALDGGSQTSVGIEPRIAHQFAKVPTSELQLRRDDYWDSLVKVAQRTGDAATIAKYPPRRLPGITQTNFGNRRGGGGF